MDIQTSGKPKKPKWLRIISRWKFIRFILILIAFFLLIRWTINLLFKGKTIDNVRVEVLTAKEQRALKMYPNAYHLETGRKQGIAKPIKSQEEMLKNSSMYIRTYDLEKIKDNRFYEVPSLSHSLPYLKDDAKDFLNDLGRRFHKRLDGMGVRDYRFSITSILRTTNDQKGLRKSNVNATPNNSSHYYGLTFDLSQTRFFESGKRKPIYSYRLRNLLLRELIDMQNEGKCYVLLENQTKCIHITVR